VSEHDHSAGPESIDDHQRHIKAQGLVREVFLNLVKHSRTSRLYGTGHHHARRFLDAYVNAMNAYLEDFELLHVEIAPDDILWQGQLVLSKGTSAEQMTYGLYAEGARGLAVERGAETKELVRLAKLLSRDWLHRTAFDDDLIAAAWRADFSHVHVDVADRFTEDSGEGGDASLRDDLALGRSAGAELHRLTGDSVLVPQIQGLLKELEANAIRREDFVVMKQDEAEVFLRLKDELDLATGGDSTDEEEDELLRLDAGARAALDQEVAQVEAGEDADFETISRVLFELVRLETDDDKMIEIGKDCALHLVALFERGESDNGSALVRRVMHLSHGDLFPGEDVSRFLDGFSAFVDEDHIARLVPALHRQGEVGLDRGPLFTVLGSLPRSAVPGLLRLAETLKTTELRQVVADALVVVLEHDVDALLQLLSQVRGDASIAPLLALGRLDAVQALDVCMGRVGDPVPAAREAALRSLRRYQSKRIKDEMLRGLDDEDEGVRVEALRYMAVYRDSSHLSVLESKLRGGVLRDAGPREVRAWMRCYALVGRLNAVPMLRSVAIGELDVGASSQVAEQALRALIVTGAPEARRAVDEVARRRPEFREIVREIASEQRRKRSQGRS